MCLDEADRAAGHKIGAPMLVLWGAKGRRDRGAEIPGIWQNWASDVQGVPVDCGHFIPEEAPDVVVDQFIKFFGS